jgi:hypothetical protein
VLRREVSLLCAGGKTILPVLVGGARVPASSDLPHDLRPLVDHQAPSLDNMNWRATVQAMIDAIEAALTPVQAPPSVPSPEAVVTFSA